MKILLRLTAVLSALLLATTASAAGKKLTLGVYLPTALDDGDARFQFAERLAKQLSEALGKPVTAKNFGRFEDFTSAANKGQIDIAVVDGWAALQAPAKMKPVGMGEIASSTYTRWALVSREKHVVNDLAGQKLATPKLPGAAESRLVSNLVFQGDYDAKNFKLVPVPNVESALKMLETKGADAALVPARLVPKGAHVAFKSSRLPQAVVLATDATLTEKLTSLSAEPFSKFTAANEGELQGLKRLFEKGPAPRLCVMADSPILALDTTQMVNFGEVERVLPTFTKYVEVPNETPDP